MDAAEQANSPLAGEPDVRPDIKPVTSLVFDRRDGSSLEVDLGKGGQVLVSRGLVSAFQGGDRLSGRVRRDADAADADDGGSGDRRSQPDLYGRRRRGRADLIGQNIFSAFPAADGVRSILEDSFRRVRDLGKPDVLVVMQYPILVGDRLEDRYWSCSHVPLRDEDGEIAFILQNTQDVTALHSAKPKDGKHSPPGATLETVVMRRAERVQALNVSLLERAPTSITSSCRRRASCASCAGLTTGSNSRTPRSWRSSASAR